MSAEPAALKGLGDRSLISEAKKHAYRLDPRSVVRRAAKAESERTVTCRPAPDTMTYVTGLLPVAQGVAVKAALTRAADHHIRITGDERGRGQIMADTLVERVTGRTFTHPVPGKNPEAAATTGLAGMAGSSEDPTLQAESGEPGQTVPQRQAAADSKDRPATGAGVEVQLIMTDRTLFAGDNEPAYLRGYGTVPAGWARNLIRDGGNTDGDNGGETAAGRVWIRRLYTAPDTGRLISMDSRARIFPQGLRKFLISRDQTCRTPWCDAPIRHIDHITPHSKGGQTSEANSQGLCQLCNLAKEAPGFTAKPIDGPRHSVQLTTPTGHTYESTAPPPPGTPPPGPMPTTHQATPRSLGRNKGVQARPGTDPGRTQDAGYHQTGT
ncbi:HNH endonuclease [Arthrobacter monumenti]